MIKSEISDSGDGDIREHPSDETLVEAKLGTLELNRAPFVLQFVHVLLDNPEIETSISSLLVLLAQAFACSGAGLSLIGGKILLRHPEQNSSDPPKWLTDPGLLDQVMTQRLPVCFVQSGCSSLVADIELGDGTSWILWVEDRADRIWTSSDKAALQMVSHTILHSIQKDESFCPRWVSQMHTQQRQLHLEKASSISRYFVHEYGNVLTGIVGFVDLCVTKPNTPPAVLQSYLAEIHQCARDGVRLTEQIRLFCGHRQSGKQRSSLSNALSRQKLRLDNQLEHQGKFRLVSMETLPFIAMDSENLAHLLGAILDNAAEATPAKRSFTVAAELVELKPTDCLDYLGRLQAGTHVQLVVRDSGPGIPPDHRNRLFRELFFTTKPNQRGLGLLMAQGILTSYHGGMILRPATNQGLEVELMLPIAA